MAAHGPAARRRRGHRRGDHHEPARVGGLRPRRRLQRSDGRLSQLQVSLPRRRSEGSAIRDRLPELRPAWDADRAAAVQPHVRHPGRSGGGQLLDRLPAAGDGAGHVRPVRQRGDQHAAQASLRDRPDRPILPQRDHAGQLHLSAARVRADGDGVLRPSPRRGRVVRLLGGCAPSLVDRCAGHRRRAPAPAPARAR